MQVNPTKTRMYLSVQPPSWITEAQSFLGKMSNKMKTWKMSRVKVILRTAEVPKHAVAAPSKLTVLVSSPAHVINWPLPSVNGFKVYISVNATNTLTI